MIREIAKRAGIDMGSRMLTRVHFSRAIPCPPPGTTWILLIEEETLLPPTSPKPLHLYF